MAQLAAPVGAKISAVEPDRIRQEKFKENMQRLHPESDIPLFRVSLQEFAVSTSKRFHGILLDAPCSGTGVIGRHPDIRWNRRAEDFTHYQDTQLGLLQSAATLLLPRGILVYATCSLEKEENEEVIDCFLTANSNFSLGDCGSSLPPAASTLVKENFFIPLPNAEIDGFFGAILIKETDTA
jgi:16S rRNA (cytosine967-C5)-methyltransferase